MRSTTRWPTSTAGGCRAAESSSPRRDGGDPGGDGSSHPPSLAFLTERHAGAGALTAAVAAHHRAYLEVYHRNAKMMRVVEEVTNLSPAFRRERTERAQTWIAGNREAIGRLQRDGRADCALHPATAARALSTMVSRTAYITFVLEEEGAEAIDGVAETLARLWINALKLAPS